MYLPSLPRIYYNLVMRDGPIPHFADMPILAFANTADTAHTRILDQSIGGSIWLLIPIL